MVLNRDVVLLREWPGSERKVSLGTVGCESQKTVSVLEIRKGNFENIAIGMCVLHIFKGQHEPILLCDWPPKQARWGYLAS